MEILIAVSLVIIATILFYRLVERKHKIVVAKIMAALLLLAASGAVILWQSDTRATSRQDAIQRSVSVQFEPDSAYAHRYSSDNPFLAMYERTDTLSTMSFRMCNQGKDTVESVSFRPATRKRGRSTEYDVATNRGYGQYSDSRLRSDFILAPKECNTVTWPSGASRQFILLDTVLADNVMVEVREHN